MSITQPADSGGGDSTVQVDNNVTVIDEMVSWAQLMEEEEYVEVGEEEGTDEVDGGQSSISPERKRIIPDEPPFKAQITNISRDQAEEEIFYYFGGDVTVKSIDVFSSKGRAEIEFRTKDGLIQAVAKDGVEFDGRTLRVFVQRNIEHAGKITSRIDSRYSTDNDMQSRRRESQRGSHYNSQSSLNSDKHSRYSKDGYRDNFHTPNHYGTMPAGGYHDKRQSSTRGGHNSHYHNDGGDRGNFKHPRNPGYPMYERQQSGPQFGNRYRGEHGGPLQRSGSYQSNRYDGKQGAPISSKSRTDSHSTNFDSYSRTSSRMSIDEPQKIASRKPSANPFGDAKPVDTQTKLLEMEQRELEKKRIEEEARKSQSTQNLTETSTASEEQGKSSQASNSDEHSAKQRFSGQPRHQNQNKYHHQGGHQNQRPPYHAQKESLYEADNGYEHSQNERRGSFEQGAPPGSVIIKKRETTETEKQRDEECCTPPVDPIQYPTTIEHSPVVRKESGEKNYNNLPPHNPHHSYNKQSKNTVRPSPKTYVPPKHTLQKSATMGQIEKVSRNDADYRTKENVKSSRGGGYKHEGTRRPSFSGSEGGRGETTKSRGSGAKRGMRGTGRGAGNTRGTGVRGGRGGARRADVDMRKNSDQGPETIPETDKPKKEVYNEKVVNEGVQEKKEEKREEVKVAATVEKEKTVSDEVKNDDSSKSSIPPTQQSAQKKKDRKKEKKKEAKNSPVSGNKYAVLLDCSQ